MNRATTVGVLLLAVALVCVQCVSVETTAGKGVLYVVSAHEGGDGMVVAHQLTAKGFSVHGVFEELVVVSLFPSSSTSTLSSLKHLERTLASLPLHIHYTGDVDKEGQYYVLERADRAFAFYNSPIKVPDTITVLYSTTKRAVVYTPSSSPHIHTLLSHTSQQENEDFETIPLDISTTIHLGLRKELESVVSAVYANATRKYLSAPDPVISKLVDQVSPKTLRSLVTYLSGEDPSSNILTRNARSSGAKDAQEWLEDRFSEYGLIVTTQMFNNLYSSNVIGVKHGATDPSKVVVIGAHYDSRGPDISSTTQRAPGANDNGSGTGAVLHIAKIFNDSAAKFDYTIHFIVYSGEEQGLLGSAAYARKLIDDRVTVIGVLNADMIAYRVTGERTQCAFPSRYSTPQIETIARTAVYTYVPELTIGITTACCSDHQSYYNNGFPATGFFERNGAIADNQYHKSADLVERPGYDVEEQYTQLTKGVLATLATIAGAIKT